MGRTAVLDAARRRADGAAVAASLLLPAWLLAGALPAGVPRAAAAAGLAAAGTAGVLRASRWRTLLRCAPVAAGLAAAAGLLLRDGSLGPAAAWLLLAGGAGVLLRRAPGARAGDGPRDLHRRRARPARQATPDPLTGVGDRTVFLDRAADALAGADGTTTTAVLLFDLDGFEAVDDAYGPAGGDDLLRTAAQRLAAAVRAGDTVARLGGGEFAVLLPRLADDTVADVVAGRILRDLMQPLAVGDALLGIPASAGIAVARGGADPSAVLHEADLALYQAKAEGSGVARRYDPDRCAAAAQRRAAEADLRRGLDGGEFEVYYQPIVQLDGERTAGAEALVRWRHPHRGLLTPAAFLEVAESAGLLPRLGGWVLETACAQAAVWQRHTPGFELSVNLSASQLGDPHLVGDVRGVLERTGLAPHLLVLELTESVAVGDPAEPARVLRELKGLGVRIALDDFGTGFSSLSHLGVLPVDVVKIDRSFVQAMVASPGASVAEAVLHIARTFDLAPVAEGVEDAAQADRLRELACAQAQGYHFARPMPADGVSELLYRQALLHG